MQHNYKNKKIVKIGMLVGIVVLVAIIIFLPEKNSPELQYDKYTDTELGFEISYPRGWGVEERNAADPSKYKYVDFLGELDRQKRVNYPGCDPEKYPASIYIRKFGYFSSASFGPVNNEEDLENFFNSKTGIVEKFPASGENNLLVVEAYSGAGDCARALYVGWLVTEAGEHYQISFHGAEDRYDIIRPVFESFKLIN